MAFKEFMAQVRTRGLAMRSHYYVEITPPPFLMTTNAELIQTIPLFCEQAMFPEFALQTTLVKDAGLNREVVYDKAYGTVTLTFACDQQMRIKEFFDVWAKAPVLSEGGLFRYPTEYIVPSMRIYQVDSKKENVYSVILKDVYPKIVNDIFLNAQDKSYANFQVQFVYESWESVAYAKDLPAIKGSPARLLDFARILDYAGGVSKEGFKSAIITRGAMVVQDILTGTSNAFKLGNLL